MSINIKSSEVEIRESRLGSNNEFKGTARELCDKSTQNRFCGRNRSFTQCTECSSSRALSMLVMIQDAAIINHAPLGCSADFAEFNFTNRGEQIRRKLPLKNVNLLSTNLEEKDMIYGGGAKLEATIRDAYIRFKPKAIFVTTSCASSIIGDDVSGITDKLESELGIPVVYISCEGFKSKIWATGFDSAFHGIIRKIVKPSVKKEKKLVNVINFWGSDVFTDLFRRIGLKPNYIVPFTTIEQLEKISEAAATVEVCPTLGTYLAAALEQEYGVPEVKSPPPYGLKASDQFFRELGKVTHKEREVEILIKQERKRISEKLEELRDKLKNKKVYVCAGAAHGHSLLGLMNDLGMNVVGAGIFHHDPHYDNGDEKCDVLKHVVDNYGDIKNFNVCNKQVFELVNTLNKLKPDVLIVRHGGLSAWGVNLGIPTLLIGDEQFGISYQGILNYGNKILDTLATKEFVGNIAAHSDFPYTSWWMNQDPQTFLGREKIE
ncbi:nitrogenase component 1 [Clostridium ljungdahlii]|uniref:Nitrogenase molybdenum-iron protein alpha chain n=1 Tax=Clostridium ljungdahlii TaxID=1538 RepID=A0A162L1J3_9CLOT|nr:nitrogenase component 1 [Clostridium ljungdahlii]OAA83068.1 Nitrogenase molybdenum-iron protein alpha chain [Clostridium ljungdahlii]